MGSTYTVPAKPFWFSKTLLLNVLAVVVIGLGIVVDSQGILQLPDRAFAWATVVLAILNAVNRFFTMQPVDGSARLSFQKLELTDSNGTAERVKQGG